MGYAAKKQEWVYSTIHATNTATNTIISYYILLPNNATEHSHSKPLSGLLPAETVCNKSTAPEEICRPSSY